MEAPQSRVRCLAGARDRLRLGPSHTDLSTKLPPRSQAPFGVCSTQGREPVSGRARSWFPRRAGVFRRGRACPVPLASVLLAGTAWLAAAGFGSEEQPESQPPVRSVRDGVYTEAQAARGKTVYLEQCVECHKEDLRGDQQMTPSLVGIAFTFRWKDKKLYDYLVGMRNTMPQGAPGKLERRDLRRPRRLPAVGDRLSRRGPGAPHGRGRTQGDCHRGTKPGRLTASAVLGASLPGLYPEI